MAFIWIILALFVLSFVYIGRRLVCPLRLAPAPKRLVWIALPAWGVGIIAAVFLGRNLEGTLGDILAWFGYVSMGLLSFLFFTLLLRDIALLIARGIAWLRSVMTRRTQPMDRARRAHLVQISNIGVVGAAVALTSYGIFEARRRPGIVEITVPIARLPAAFVGLRIVQISDVHAGLTIGRDWIETIVEEVESLKPDLIAFTGDLADGSVPRLRDDVAPFGRLRAPLGAFFITGNHEYYSGAEAWVEEVRRLGYDVLLNEHRIIERGGAQLVLAGVTDFTAEKYVPAHKSDPAKAFRDAPPDLVRIFLAHQPKTLRQTDGLHFDLMLSGHTHGGQFFPWNLATAVDQPFLKGLHDVGGRWIYVSKGTGYWGPPVRVGARSEITAITLAAAGAA